MGSNRQKTIAENAVGQVKFFKELEGFGFIRIFDPDDTKEEVFFHISECKSDIVYKDWWLEFDIVSSEKGPRAKDVRRVSQPPEHELFGTNFNY
jgi:CspA family cold shock protein